MRRKRGFTLIELIAVLIVLAVLAAATVSALTAYIRRAKELGMVARARAALLAAQTILIERYGTEDWTVEAEPIPLLRRGPGRAPGVLTAEEVLALAEIPPEDVEDLRISWDEHASVTQFVWTEGESGGTRSAVWNGTGWDIRHDKLPEKENPDGFGNKD